MQHFDIVANALCEANDPQRFLAGVPMEFSEGDPIVKARDATFIRWSVVDR